MKILSWLRALSTTRNGSRDEEIARWVVDPLSHPTLDAMSERELGDMPFRLTARRTTYEMGTACR